MRCEKPGVVLLVSLLLALSAGSGLADAPKGSWRTSPDSKDFGRLTIEFFGDDSALMTAADGKSLHVLGQHTEKPGCVRLVPKNDEDYSMLFEQKNRQRGGFHRS